MSCGHETVKKLFHSSSGNDKVGVKSKAIVEASANVGLMTDRTPDIRFLPITHAQSQPRIGAIARLPMLGDCSITLDGSRLDKEKSLEWLRECHRYCDTGVAIDSKPLPSEVAMGHCLPKSKGEC
jgi:hypothetical protein